MRHALIITFLLLSLIAQAQQLLNSVEYVRGSTVKIEQIVGEFDREWKIPTLNRTQSRYKLYGTDLGVPFRHYDRTYILFGDTQGANGGDAIAYTMDSNPSDGLELAFIHDVSGTYLPVKIPGISQADFEVPLTGVSHRGKMYIYHSTGHTTGMVMEKSVLAVASDRFPVFQYLFDFSSKHFINIALSKVDASSWMGLPMRKDSVLIMFGSGKYRESDVRLAVQAADSIESKSSVRYFAGLDRSGNPIWAFKEDDAIALFHQPCVGELSVSYNRFIRRWIMLYNCHLQRGINFRVAEKPWGPWSEAKVLFDPRDDNGYCHFMHTPWNVLVCDSVHDPGRENEWGGEYGPYQYEEFATGNDSTTTIYFNMSTWNPYTVVLMKSTLRLLSKPTTVQTEASQWHLELQQNYPNPFSESTKIDLTPTLSYEERELRVFDLFGREVLDLTSQLSHDSQIEIHRSHLPSPGLYFYRLTTPSHSQSKIMVMLK